MNSPNNDINNEILNIAIDLNFKLQSSMYQTNHCHLTDFRTEKSIEENINIVETSNKKH
jgi:hypothetical protein